MVPPTHTVLCGDARSMLRTLPPNSVHCCVTSPPYYGLRDYGTKPVEWADGEIASLGLEKSPASYVRHLLEVLEEVRRILRDDGTLWLNLGDSYAGGGCGKRGNRWRDQHLPVHAKKVWLSGGAKSEEVARRARDGVDFSAFLCKPKDLLGMPWRVALALQAAGWWLRTDICWHKPNAMPESITDRPARAHEFLFLLSKSPHYFYDATAVLEPVSGNAHSRGKGVHPKCDDRKLAGKQNESYAKAVVGLVEMRNLRDVWTIASKPFKGAHFATFPPKLIEPCVKAGTSEAGCCGKCGAPFKRVVIRTKMVVRKGPGRDPLRGVAVGAVSRTAITGTMIEPARSTTLRWDRACTCHDSNAIPVPCTVLDPFAGAGTTGVVAKQHGRSFVGVELKPEYARMARRRIDND